ncbi:SDR family oxidoreductase [Bradyrhizobium sp. U87765 SZCCT0131]|uniref:SDR family oxidoreductase n=1 Tax=unclassified Bradyrhizobium TaxID=2631580 RepID=UPI001BAB44D6|nr:MULTISPECIES: SDR family oxidoreductase [unclassified Bradyrhizobium]MBR1218012.1 SDR family oxidoreductase [Bradyrhizobium sp. U87765 SZCCT0131]MBR1261042.1 SDR family oxidoreductase [Bradyrhizobium sp. U87765 SZCCT0134]MBR1303510.1 SDR family oxidoreductase [Bradyrhizobium sp. U87765 SZCCT0110]MBR1319116.1 SDR family oxidoreductase [Bradyrhizobium sp. U87765 SZCCT0109]MBR1347441.1 SDR family oxidoreductase [Bradyrhizobium sp. U87765 SZCCT0048]
MNATKTIPIPPYVDGHGLLKGRSVLITAAAGVGIGFAAARKAVEEGCRAIMISDIHERRLAEAAEKLREYSATVEIYSQICNVTSEEQVQSLIEAAEDKLGGIDVLINNAGLGGLKPIVEMTDQEWNLVLDVTLTGTMRMTRAALKKMMPRGRGAIVNNASVLGWRAQKGQAHYAAAKAGVMALTRCSAVEAAEYGIRINAVSPSIAMHDFLKRASPQEQLDALASQEAFGRAAEVWEIANVLMFLASDYAGYMVGEIVSVSSQRA